MKKYLLSLFFSLTGLILVMMGLFLLSEAYPVAPIIAQDDEAEYEGLRTCSECHSDVARIHSETSHSLTLQEVSRNEEAILANFEDEANTPLITFPDSAEPRPLTSADIAYTLGAGKYLQRYLYEVGRNDLQLLPVEWNTVTGAWQPFLLDETGDWLSDAYDFGQNCAYCHTSGFDTERFRWEDDGVQCESCHGLGSIHAEEADGAGRNPSERELTRIKEAINLSTDAQICGQCHSQGQSPEAHPFPIGFVSGGTLISDETYSLISTDDPLFWWGTGNGKRTNMQYNEWSVSEHAEANVTCASCHYPHAEESQPALLRQEPYSLCASCHNNTPLEDESLTDAPPNIEMYEGITIVEEVGGIPSAHFSAEDDAPDCLTCHMPEVPVEGFTRPTHTFKVILPEAILNVPEIADGCTSCHQDQTTPENMQLLINDIQASTRGRIEVARTQITDSSPVWVVTALDFIESDGSEGIHNYTYTDALLDAIETALNMSQP
mgnify:CR=1 FL=1